MKFSVHLCTDDKQLTVYLKTLSAFIAGGLNDLRVDTMITKCEFGKSERTHHPPSHLVSCTIVIIIIKSTKCVQDTLPQFVGCNMQINQY